MESSKKELIRNGQNRSRKTFCKNFKKTIIGNYKNKQLSYIDSINLYQSKIMKIGRKVFHKRKISRLIARFSTILKNNHIE